MSASAIRRDAEAAARGEDIYAAEARLSQNDLQNSDRTAPADTPGSAYNIGPALGDLLNDVREFFGRYVICGLLARTTVALWVAHSYVFEAARATPYLHFWSPDPGSGKTTALEVIEVLGREAMTVDNVTGPSLFRLIEQERPTLLIDEVDGIFGKRSSDAAEEIRIVLNSGYSKGKRAIRMGGPQRDQIMFFDPFCPKALAGLKQLPSTVAHRSIPIAMEPPRPDEPFDDFDVEEAAENAAALRARLEAWAAATFDALTDPARKPARLPDLDARRNQLWRILFRIADLAGGDWTELARLAALEFSAGGRRHDEASAGIRLLGHIRDVFEGDKMTCAAIADALNADDEMPYGGWNNGAGIKTRELGLKLRPYRIVAKTIRVDQGTRKGYDRAQFAEAWARYLADTATRTGTTGTSGSQSQNQAEKEQAQSADVPLLETPAISHEQSDVPVVPLLRPGYGGGGGDECSLEEALQAPTFVGKLIENGIIEAAPQ